MALPTNTLTLKVSRPGEVTPLEGTWKIRIAAVDGIAVNKATGEGMAGAWEQDTTAGLATFDLPDNTHADFEPVGGMYVASFFSKAVRFASNPFDMDVDKSFADIKSAVAVDITQALVDVFETLRTDAQTAADASASSATAAAASAASVQRGEPNGIAPLDGAGKLPETNVPERLSETGLSATAGVRAKPASTQFKAPTGVAVFRQETVYNYLTWSQDGDRIFARDLSSNGGKNVAVSTDNGATWTRVAAPDATFGPNYAWTTASGALLVLCGPNLYRSTDNGVSFTLALSLGSAETILDGGLVQTTNGNLYAGVYSSGGDGTWYTSGAPVYQSTDDGVSWTVHSSFPSTMKGASGTSAIRHIHGMLAVGNDLWCATGDSPVESGIWKWSGSAWVRQTPLDTAGNGHRFAAVSFIERSGYLYWALDTNADDPGKMMRAPMTDLTAWEELADLPTSAYYSTKMPDGTLVFGGSIEVGTGGFQDDTLRLWTVGADNAVHEAWAAPIHKDGTGNRPVGALRAHPTNGTLIFTTKMMLDYSDPTKQAAPSFLATVRKGLTRTPQRTATRVNPATWQTKGTVVDPSTTATSAATALIVETVNVDIKGLTVLVLWSGTFACSAAAARITVVPVADGGSGATADQRSATHPTAYGEVCLSGQALLTFTTPGKHTVDLKFFVGSGTGVASSVKRSITVIEQPS